MRYLSVLTLVGAPLAVSSAGLTAPAERATCFFPSQVSGFSDAGPDKALFRIGTRVIWEVTTGPGCPNVDWAQRIGIRARGGQRVCTGRPAELLVPEASERGFRSCLVRSVRKLSAAEADAAQGLVPR